MIKQWPQIKAGDADAYRRFQNFLVMYENIDQLQKLECGEYIRHYLHAVI